MYRLHVPGFRHVVQRLYRLLDWSGTEPRHVPLALGHIHIVQLQPF
jgi:hypothetical protein